MARNNSKNNVKNNVNDILRITLAVLVGSIGVILLIAMFTNNDSKPVNLNSVPILTETPIFE